LFLLKLRFVDSALSQNVFSDIPDHWRSQQTERFLSGAEYPDGPAGKDCCSFTAITVDI
jgi:hypothetical protein